MRIHYLIPGPMGRTPEGQIEMARRGALLESYAAPGTEIGISCVDEGPASIESMYEEYLSIPASVKRAVQLGKRGVGCHHPRLLSAIQDWMPSVNCCRFPSSAPAKPAC